MYYIYIYKYIYNIYVYIYILYILYIYYNGFKNKSFFTYVHFLKVDNLRADTTSA